jgi:tRNA (cmo5U34)-methyltransferase
MKNRTDFQSGPISGGGYDKFREAMPWYGQMQEGLATTLAAKLKRIKNPVVLELGCGTGITTEQLLKHVNGVELVSLDSSRPMMAEAKKRVGRKAVRWFAEDAISFLDGCAPNQFHAVASAFMIHNMPTTERSRLFRGIHKVVMKGGWFINADKYARDNEEQHLEDIVSQLLDFDKFADDVPFRRKWVRHYLMDEAIKFTEAEQRRIASSSATKGTFVLRQRMEALFLMRIVKH